MNLAELKVLQFRKVGGNRGLPKKRSEVLDVLESFSDQIFLVPS